MLQLRQMFAAGRKLCATQATVRVSCSGGHGSSHCGVLLTESPQHWPAARGAPFNLATRHPLMSSLWASSDAAASGSCTADTCVTKERQSAI